MKKITLLFSYTLLALIVRAQGLECVVVEPYYISDANDSTGNDIISVAPGTLPVGSVTWRIYADMLQGYNFQGVYGVDVVPAGPSVGDHELRIETTTLFFNNEDRGATSPTYTKTQARGNTVMLDSWLSVGAACAGNYGILKANDDGVATVSNLDGVLQNNDPFAGIPLTQQDGIILGTPTPNQVTFVGFSPSELAVFDNTTVGSLFSTYNATWASLGGSKGPDTVANKVLIGQFTTNGVFSYKLNIQIGTPTGGTESYVAENPVGNEIMLPCLSGSFNVGISQHQNSSDASSVLIYPNPTYDFAMLEFSPAPGQKNSNVSYTIYDLQGKNILRKNLGVITKKYSERIDLSSLASGMYVVAVSVDENISHKKIIKN